MERMPKVYTKKTLVEALKICRESSATKDRLLDKVHVECECGDWLNFNGGYTAHCIGCDKEWSVTYLHKDGEK